MPRVKILLGPISPEWRSLLIKLADSDDELEIVGATEDFVDLLVEVEKLKADVVVLSQLPNGSEPGICSHLVLEHSNLRMLLLPSFRGQNLPFSLVLRKEWLKDVSSDTLRHALRSR
jgi:hypothetical protein